MNKHLRRDAILLIAVGLLEVAAVTVPAQPHTHDSINLIRKTLVQGDTVTFDGTSSQNMEPLNPFLSL